MANWVGASRTNAFKVADEAAFKSAMQHFEVTVREHKEQDGSTRFALFSTTDDGAWPTTMSLNDTVASIVNKAMDHDDFDDMEGAVGDLAYSLVDQAINQLGLESVHTDDCTLAARALSEEDPMSPEVDFFDWVGRYLADGEISVFQEIGSERSRYLSGSACAIRNDGERVQLDLNDIYALALEKLGAEPTRAEY